MTMQPQTMIAVDMPRFIALEEKVARVLDYLENAQLTPKPASGDWMSIADAAAHLNCHPSTIRRRIEAGEIEANGLRGKMRRVRLP